MKGIARIGYSALLTSMLLVTIGCSDRKASDSRDASTKYSAGQSIRIVFSLPGDDMGAAEDREILARISEAFIKGGIADIVRKEFGMGRMEIIIRAKTELSSDSIDRIILTEYPKAKFWKEETRSEMSPNNALQSTGLGGG